MKTASACVLLVPLLVGGLTAGPARLTPEQAAPLRAERQIAVQIKQVYSWQDVDDDGNVKEVRADTPDAQKKPRDLLPLAAETAKALGFAGWRPAPTGTASRVVVKIRLSGYARSAEYLGTVSGRQYSGASVHGQVEVQRDETQIIFETFSGEIAPPNSVNRYYLNEWDAPIGELLVLCIAALYRALEAVHGAGPLLAAVSSDDRLHRDAAATALCARADPDHQRALLQLLRQGDDNRRAIAAAALGIVGDEAAFAPLLEAFRATAGEETPNREYSDIEWKELTVFERGLEPREARRDTAQLFAKDMARDAVQWALMQNPAPDKAAKLAELLRDPGIPPMVRRGLALVLGHTEGPMVAQALTVAARDKSPLVRAAALNGLKHYRFRQLPEAATAVFALTTDAHPFVRERAREVAGEYAPSLSLKYTYGKYGQDIHRHPANLNEELLSHPDAFIRLSAVNSSRYSSPEDMSATARLLRTDPAPVVREAVVKLLAEHRRAAHTEDFAFALSDKDEATRWRAFEALKDGGNAVPAGETEETKPTRLPEHTLAPLLALAGASHDVGDLLERVQGEGVNDALLVAAESKSAGAPGREAAMIELARRGDRRATPLLAAFLAAGEPVARPHLWPLTAGPLNDEALVDPLIKILRQGPEGSQALAVDILGAMSHTRAVGPMIVALRQAHDRNRQDLSEQLGRALENLTGRQFYGPDEWLAWWKQNAGKPIIKPKAQQ